MAKEYQKLIKTCHKVNNYWDEAYYEGYSNGLLLIEMCEDNNSIVNVLPFLYLPNAKQPLTTYTIFMDELARVSRGRSKYLAFAKTIVKEKKIS
ncbi:hypothetical protein ACVS9P_08505 [Caproicibacterium sp. NSD3]